ncbi:Axin interactor, dorsalization-associated protein [Galemys pyrenaicus]|uniref:Axin interactor, dorsalization-associated protein n=1 Tax=Galemys pyrenaicus TaxID=202257 RepID=A0A8J6AMB3_GALPY|nr:Axin interactor, dorsalization-associated protein [Galemys pyrenaicus]
MSEVTRGLLQRWGASFRRGADFDSWGQLVEAIDEYQILARHLQKEAQAQHNNSEFTEEQKKTIGKIATCLELRSAALQSTQSQEEFKLEDLKKLEPILKNILTYNKEFPFDVQPVPLRRILAPGEEENLEFEEDEEEGGAGAGSPDSFPARVPVWGSPPATSPENLKIHTDEDGSAAIEVQRPVIKSSCFCLSLSPQPPSKLCLKNPSLNC